MFIWPTLQSRRTRRTTTRTRAVSGPPSSWGSTCRPSTAWKPYVQKTTTTPFYFTLTLFVICRPSREYSTFIESPPSPWNSNCMYSLFGFHVGHCKSSLSCQSLHVVWHEIPVDKWITFHYTCIIPALSKESSDILFSLPKKQRSLFYKVGLFQEPTSQTC